MDDQHSWHWRSLWPLYVANLLSTTALFMQFRLLRPWAGAHGEQWAATCLSCGVAMVVGMFVLGPLGSRLVEVFRRKDVCEASLLLMLLAAVLLVHVETLLGASTLFLMMGMGFSLTQMSLGSTLLNDLSVSAKRTPTDFYYLWAGRIGWPLGMLLPVALAELLTLKGMGLVGGALCGVAVLLVMSLKVSFRAPIKVPVLSMDRFWKPQAWPLVANLLPVAMIQGFVLASPFLSMASIGAIALGLFVAFATHRLFFEAADNRAPIVAGLLLEMAAMGLIRVSVDLTMLHFACVMFGIGMGWAYSRFVLYFLKLSGHCQRGTLQQTYVLSVMTGLVLGFILAAQGADQLMVPLLLAAAAMLLYLGFTHRWFARTADRSFKFREV
ncbi:MAG: hypothetical protein IJ244_01740 [Bacteroidaceae bacterium]|nr:hypothetical protein [Bacteroidaceae bacterium]